MTPKGTRLRLVATAATVVLLASACQGSAASPAATGGAATSAASAAPATQQAKVRIAFVAGQIGITFYTGVECGAKQAAKEFNVDLNWNGSHNWDINEERPIIDADLATNPDGWVISPTDPDALIAVARYEPGGGSDVAEVAFVVEDGWQDRGLGTVLFGELLRAATLNGIVSFRAWVLADNRRMLDLITRLGRVQERRVEQGVVELAFTA
jgi:GNAT superfamily N-acetyltransferase